MKRSEYKDIDVQCPFYKKEDARNIKCEGISNESIATTLEFQSKRGKEITKEKHCRADYKNCPLYQELDKKYR